MQIKIRVESKVRVKSRVRGIVATDRDSAMIKTTEDKASRVKAIVDVHIMAAKGATITII